MKRKVFWLPVQLEDKLPVSLINEVQRVTPLPAAIKTKCTYSTSPIRNGNKTQWMWMNQSGWLFLITGSTEASLVLLSQSSQTSCCVTVSLLQLRDPTCGPGVHQGQLGTDRGAVAFSWGLWERERSFWLWKVQLDGACLRIWSHVWSWRILVVFLHSSGCPYKQELASS